MSPRRRNRKAETVTIDILRSRIVREGRTWRAVLKMRLGPWVVTTTGKSNLPENAARQAVRAGMDSFIDAMDRVKADGARERARAAVPFAAFAPIDEDPK